MRHHLVRWHEKYSKQGLVVVEIDGGQFETLKRVRHDVREKGVPQPVLWDKDRQNHERYGITAWPVAYLIGPDGKVVWEGNPARIMGRPAKRQALIRLIETELEGLGPGHSNFNFARQGTQD